MLLTDRQYESLAAESRWSHPFLSGVLSVLAGFLFFSAVRWAKTAQWDSGAANAATAAAAAAGAWCLRSRGEPRLLFHLRCNVLRALQHLEAGLADLERGDDARVLFRSWVVLRRALRLPYDRAAMQAAVEATMGDESTSPRGDS